MSVPPTASPPPRIVVTVAATGGPGDPALAARKRTLYEASMSRQGASPIMVDAATAPERLADALATMDGLLLSGGADLHPAQYGGTERGSTAVEPARDALEAEAWSVAQQRGLPVLGICRGFQAINVFSGGSLLQHVDGHLGPAFGKGAAMVHPVRVAPGTRLARILFPTNAGGGVLRVNSYHHQAVRGVGPGARARRQCLGEQPGRRPRRRPRGRRRALRVRAAVPSRAIGIDPGRVRAAVQGLRRRGSRPGRSPLTVARAAGPLRPRSLAAGAGLQPAGLDDPLQELPGARLAWSAEDLVRRSHLADQAGIEEAHAVGDVAGEAHLVGGDDHRHARCGQLADDVQDLGHELRVERAGDLVEEQDVRLHGQRPDDRHPLLLSAGQPVGQLVALVGQAEPGKQLGGLAPRPCASVS